MADPATIPGPVEDDAALEEMLDLSKKKKKKKAAKILDDEITVDAPSAGDAPKSDALVSLKPHAATSVSEAAAALAALSLAGSNPFDYDKMLSTLYNLLHANNPQLTDRHRKKLRPPEVMRVGTTRTAWVNFKESCASIDREQEHVMSFFLAELGTTGSIDGSQRFLMRGRYLPKYIENLLRKYITEFVTCHMCKSLETALDRDAVSRLYFLSCKACGSSRSVAPIKAGFHATSKGERKKAREAAS